MGANEQRQQFCQHRTPLGRPCWAESAGWAKHEMRAGWIRVCRTHAKSPQYQTFAAY